MTLLTTEVYNPHGDTTGNGKIGIVAITSLIDIPMLAIALLLPRG